MNELLNRFEGSILAGRTLHAYLLAGNDPELTSATARNAASLMLYGKKDIVRLKNDPDYMEYEGSVSIGEFREVIRPEIYRETYGRSGRVVLILSANLLSPIVQNAMLKVLEEPPENTHFILTGNEYGILPTIRSRCMIIRCGTAEPGELEDLLILKGAAASEAKVFAKMSGGVTARAVRLYEDASFRELRSGVISAFIGSLKAAPDYKWSKQRRDRADFMEANEMLLLVCHDMFAALTDQPILFCPDREDELRKVSSHFTIGQIGCIIDKLTENAQRIATNAPAGMAFDRLFSELAAITLKKAVTLKQK